MSLGYGLQVPCPISLLRDLRLFREDVRGFCSRPRATARLGCEHALYDASAPSGAYLPICDWNVTDYSFADDASLSVNLIDYVQC